MSCEYKEKVIAYLKGETDDGSIEQHIEHCVQCSAMVEGYMEKEKELSIPQQSYEGKDKTLKEQVTKYEKGHHRIIVFTIVGLIMGWYSISYYGIGFLPLKIIIAIPYKISEMLHTVLHDAGNLYVYGVMGIRLDAFFPQAAIASLMAERLTPVFLGGAIYGGLAYITGDKRIFTLKGFLRFAAIWSAIILLWTGMTFVCNAMVVERNNKLEQISGFFISSETTGNGYYQENGESSSETVFTILNQAFHEDGMPKRVEKPRDYDNEWHIEIITGKLNDGYMPCAIHLQQGYLVTDKGYMYELSESFTQFVRQYYEDRKGTIFDDTRPIMPEEAMEGEEEDEAMAD